MESVWKCVGNVRLDVTLCNISSAVDAKCVRVVNKELIEALGRIVAKEFSCYPREKKLGRYRLESLQRAQTEDASQGSAWCGQLATSLKSSCEVCFADRIAAI
jgi:NAD(P)H-dependent flavin oxidoreductase YrpB (nitropropane dioxygenase family)